MKSKLSAVFMTLVCVIGMMMCVSFTAYADTTASVEFYNSNDERILAFGDETITAKLTSVGDAYILAAHFDADGRFIKAQTLTGNEPTIDVTGTEVLKIFAWDSKDTINPVLGEPGVISRACYDFKFKHTDKYLYRVGNENAVSIGSLFEKKVGAEHSDINVTITPIDTNTDAGGTYTANTSDWTKGTIKFSGTGPVAVTISDSDCEPFTLNLEVVDAVNATSATNATANNVVLLNDIGSGFTVSNSCTFYGNGFSLNYTGDGRYLNNGLKQGIVTVSGGGTLDNLRMNCSIYPVAALYHNQVEDYYEVDANDPSKTRYFYQLSAVAVSGDSTISNCYIYGARNNIYVGSGNVTIKDSILECGVVSNVQIESKSDYTVTFEDVTTIQQQTKPTTYAAESIKDNIMLGFGVLVGLPEAESNPELVLKGDFKQYNWVNEDDKTAVTDDYAKTAIENALTVEKYKHTIDGKAHVNMGIIYLNDKDKSIDNQTGLPYEEGEISVNGLTGQVYSLSGATAGQIYSDCENADKSTVNGLYKPQFKFASKLGDQYIAKTEDCDEYCYVEGADENVDVLFVDGKTVNVMFLDGETKELDLNALVDIKKYSGQDLNLQISCKDSNGNNVPVTDGKIVLSEKKDYTVTYSVTDTVFFDKDVQPVSDTIEYSEDVKLSVSLKDKATPDAYFEFDSSKQTMGYAKKSLFAGGNTQYLPFLAGLKIYDYIGQESYLRFDGDNDFNKVASATITGYTSANHVLIEVKLVDGGVINIDTTARAVSGGSTYTGSINTSGNTIYYVNDGTTSATTTTWVVSSYKFTGNNGVEINSGSVTFSNCENGSVPTGSFDTTINYTVTYDANEGNCGQPVGYATSVSGAVTLPTPTRTGYLFAGWYTTASGGLRVGGAGDSYTPSANITLYAQWSVPCTVTYNANGGSCATSSAYYDGIALTLPAATREGYWFIGWYDAPSGGNKIGDAGETYIPLSGITLYAHWQEQIKYTVTYNANGGTTSVTSATYEGTELTLPTPTRTGYKFNGWYTAASGGTKVGDAGASYTPSAAITLYAQWEKIAYTITVTTSNATVSGVTNGQTAYYGDNISITVSFSKNSNKTLTVKDASGNTVLNKNAAGTYTFTMPASNVTISASSSGSCVTGDTLVTLADGNQKRIDEVSYSDKLLVWDFEKGEYTVAPSAVIRNHGFEDNTVITLKFIDGTVTKVVNEHGYYDADLNKFVAINGNNAEDYIGHSFVKENGNGYTTVALEDVTVEEEYIEAWSLLTAHHYNFITDNIFSISSSVRGLDYFMPFEYGDDMKIDEAKMKADIEKYGLYTYEEFAHMLTPEQFDALNMPQIKVSVGKEIISWEDLMYILEIEVLSP